MNLKTKLILLLLLTIVIGGCTYEREISESEDFSHGYWSPDRKQIVFCRHYEVYRRATGLTAFPDGGSIILYKSIFMYVFNMETKKIRKITNIEGTPDGYPISVCISWKDNKIVYWLDSLYNRELNSKNEAFNNKGIFIVNTESGDKKLLVKDGTMPNISPDGKEVAYVKHDNEVWIINIDGMNDHLIKEIPNSYLSVILWQKNGKNIVLFPRSGFFELNIDTKEIKEIDRTLAYSALRDEDVGYPRMKNIANKKWGVPSFPKKALLPFCLK